MLDFEPQFPRISRAVRLISATTDNPLSGRVGEAIERRLRAATHGLTIDEVEAVETFLAGLSAQALEDVCIGGGIDRSKWIDEPELVAGFLDRAFQGAPVEGRADD